MTDTLKVLWNKNQDRKAVNSTSQKRNKNPAKEYRKKETTERGGGGWNRKGKKL